MGAFLRFLPSSLTPCRRLRLPAAVFAPPPLRHLRPAAPSLRPMGAFSRLAQPPFVSAQLLACPLVSPSPSRASPQPSLAPASPPHRPSSAHAAVTTHNTPPHRCRIAPHPSRALSRNGVASWLVALRRLRAAVTHAHTAISHRNGAVSRPRRPARLYRSRVSARRSSAAMPRPHVPVAPSLAPPSPSPVPPPPSPVPLPPSLVPPPPSLVPPPPSPTSTALGRSHRRTRCRHAPQLRPATSPRPTAPSGATLHPSNEALGPYDAALLPCGVSPCHRALSPLPAVAIYAPRAAAPTRTSAARAPPHRRHPYPCCIVCPRRPCAPACRSSAAVPHPYVAVSCVRMHIARGSLSRTRAPLMPPFALATPYGAATTLPCASVEPPTAVPTPPRAPSTPSHTSPTPPRALVAPSDILPTPSAASQDAAAPTRLMPPRSPSSRAVRLSPPRVPQQVRL
ncbi:hypothetical protein DENSPDRAFT_887271 [Dentipellis sp. KUC8613]|nr:hypothetical protein DENSPDRAFT_887271 [Dentipellis sp. KUC8613]